jgi:hypothetical protein
LLSGVAGAVDGPIPFSDSGVDFPTYDSIQSDLAALAQQRPDLAQVVHYGNTTKGVPLTMLRIANSHLPREAGRPAVEISGAIHGDEYLGIEMDMVKEFVQHPDQMPGLSLYLAAGGVIYFVPVVNPDGFTARQRENDKGADLNRDWDVIPTGQHLFKQPESKGLATYIDQDLQANQLSLKYTMDYHCCVPGLITPWGYHDAHPSQADLADYNQIADWEKADLGFPVGNALEIAGYNAVGVTIDYYYAKYGTRAFTIEGNYKGEAPRLQGHLKLADQVFEELAKKALGI